VQARRGKSALSVRRTSARSELASARRARGHPAAAHAGAAGAARRLPCDARAEVAPHNSLRSLRSLRSDRCGESVHEARAARAPTSALRFSALPKSPPPGAPCREAQPRRPACPPPTLPKRGVRAGCSAPWRRREAQGSWPRAQRASSTSSSHLSERSERSERSELCDGPRDRASQGSRRAATTAGSGRCSLPARPFAARMPARTGERRASAMRRVQIFPGT